MAFHPYPGVVPRLFNAGGFGRPRGLTPASPCPGVDHPASRPRPATSSRPVRTRFRCGSPSARPRRRPRLAGSFFNRHAVTHRVCSGCLRAHGFRRCFTPLPGCFSPFPHGTRPLSVAGECLALGGGPPCFPPGSSCPAVLWAAVREAASYAYGALTLSRAPSHASSAGWLLCDSRRWVRPPGVAPSTPAVQRPHAWHYGRFGLAPVRSPLLGGSLFDFPSSGYLDVSVPPVASHKEWVARPPWLGSPIRRPRDRSPCAAPPGLSRLAASFVGSLRLGIRRAPYIPSGPSGPEAVLL